MRSEEKLKVSLDINNNKLLAYLAGGLVLFFTLFQLLIELKKYDILIPDFIAFLISSFLFGGVFLFAHAGYHNFKEIVEIENKLNLTDFKSSNIFSSTRNKKKRISFILKIMVIMFIVFSFLIFLYINLDFLFRILQTKILFNPRMMQLKNC